MALPDDGTVSAAGGAVTLDGSGSGGAWGTNVTYGWALTEPASGVTVTFDHARSATTEVTIPALPAGTGLTFTLTVTGRGGTDGIAPATDTATVTIASDDAKLSALTVNDGTSDLTLAPAFASGTFVYAADVVAAVDEVTLSATVNQAGASVRAVTLNGTAIADSDFTDGITVSGLLVGGNEIVVTVTAQDTSSTRTYTVTVTRSANIAPTALDASVTTNEDTARSFAAADFNFSDSDGHALASVTVVTLPAEGSLTLDGPAVRVGQSVPAADIGNLVFTPAANAHGDAYARFSFRVHDGTEESAAAYTMTVNVTAMNDPATGVPAISGAPLVGQTLTAVTTGIADVDGLASPTYGYQWILVDDDGTSNPTGIGGETSATYTPVLADVGKKLRVTVSFTDDDRNDEELTSAPTATVLDPTAGICGRTPQVRDALVALIPGVNHCADVRAPHLAAITVALSVSASNITTLAAGDFDGLIAVGLLDLSFNDLPRLPDDVFDGLTALTVLDLRRNGLTTLDAGVFDGLTALEYLNLSFNGLTTLDAGVFAGLTALTRLYLNDNDLPTLDDDVFEPLTALTTLTLRDNPGAPFAPEAVALPDDGTVFLTGGTVTLDGSGSDGGPWGTNVTYGWALTDPASGVTVTFDDATSATTEVTIPALPAGTGLTFTLTVTPRGTGDAGSAPATATVTVGGGANTVDASVTTNEDTAYTFAAADFNFDDTDSSDTLVSVRIVTLPASDKGTLTLNGANVSANDSVTTAQLRDGNLKYIPPANAHGGAYASFTFKVSDGTDESTTQTMAVNITPMNDPATGAPTISGTAQAGQTLTAATTDIADVDGLANLTYGYQWIRVDVDGTSNPEDITGAMSSTYTPVKADVGRKVRVKVSFTDDDSNDEELTSAPTATVTANTAPTASDASITTNEDTARTFATADFNFTDSDGNALASVTVVRLPAEGSLTLDGPAVMAGQSVPAAEIGRMVFMPAANANGAGYANFTFRVHDGTDESASAYTMTVNVTAMNDPATGAPAISGAAQVRQTLTAVTTGIADVDGLASPTYGYQWIRVDDDGTSHATDIGGETSGTYTPVKADVGKKLRVKVSFTDDDGGDEELTSAPTATVIALPGICRRTPEVRDALVALIPGVSNCADVTAPDLAAITGTLRLNSRGITALATGDFNGLTGVTQLYVNNNALTRLPDGVFDGLTGLTGLTLFSNALTRLPDGVFDGLTGLTELILFSNALTRLPDGVFDGLTSLEQLYLNDNALPTLDDDVFEPLTALTDLDLTDNPGAPFAPDAVALPDDGTVPVAGGTVTLDGSGSGGAWGTNVTYGWALTEPVSGVTVTFDDATSATTCGISFNTTLRSCVTVTFDDATSATPVVTIPALPAGTELTFTLTVTGRGGTDGIATATATATVTATASDDAKLSALTVNDGTSDLPLAPVFASGTFAYAADVATTVDEVTLSATVNQAGASVRAVTLNGTAITDSDFTDGITVSGLLVGGNEIVVTVTAEDTSSTRTYTVTVTRSANAAPTALDASVTTDEDTAYTFAAADFNFTDTDGDALASVTVVTLPAEGSLTLDGTPVMEDQSVPAADIGQLVFTPPANGNGDAYARFSFRVHDGTDESVSAYTMTVNVTAMNDPATGAPAISGTAQAGQTLTAATTGIADMDGLPSSFTYQWVRVDDDGTSNPEDITGAMSSTYMPVTADVGRKLRVKVSFTDDDRNDEELTSAPTATVTANTAPTASDASITTNEDTARTFAAADFNFTDSDGNALASVTVMTLPGEGALTLDGPPVTTGQSVPAADIGKLVFTPAANAHGDAYARFTFRVHDGTDESASAYTMTVNVTAVNDPATGAPTISGTALVDEPLTAATTGIADVDGPARPTYGYQWIRVDADGTSHATDIGGATSATYTPVLADAGRKLRVKVSFTDDDSNDEELTSAPTARVMVLDTTVGICGRTPEVRDALVALIPGVSHCAQVTATDLAAITGNLSVSGSNITALAAGDFNGLTALTGLGLNRNALTALPAGVFAGLTALTELHLSRNALTALPAGVFAGLTALERLHLDDNDLPRLPAGVFAGLTALERLHLGYNDLPRLPAVVFAGLTALRGLDLGYNDLTALDAGVFAGLTALTRLRLDNNALARLPAGVFDGLTALRELYLNSNDLPRLPAGVFDGLTALRELYLHSNELPTLDDDVFEPLTALTDLALRDNPGAPFAPEAVALPADGTVPVSEGTVTLDGSGSDGGPWGTHVTYGWTLTEPASGVTVTFDDATSATTEVTIPALTAGTELTFTLTVTPRGRGDAGIAPAPATVTIVVPGICGRTPQVRDALVALISGVSHCADVTATHLAAITGRLLLNSKGITALVAGDFAGLTGVTELFLASNELTTLDAGVFAGLSALRRLGLRGNRLTTLPAGVFAGLPALRGLALNDNELITLDAGVFAGLPALATLALTDNPGAPFAPEAVALPDDGTVLAGGGTVTLDGSGSGGAWGTNVTYGWALTEPASGVTVTFDDARSATTEVTIPEVAVDTELTFTLTVTGRGGTDGIAPATDTATVTIVVAGICERTPEVRDVLVDLISGVRNCADVSAAHLAAITARLIMGGSGLAALKAGDFAGLPE